jgi:peptidoglycan/LPS O-acetylase OafA/YrhL
LWSIPPEIQFYAYFVLFWAGYNVFNRSKLSVFFFGLSIFLAVGFYLTRELWPGILLPNKFHVFFTGMLAAILYHNDRFHSLLDNHFKLILAFSVGALFIAYNWGHLYDGIFVAIAASAIILVVAKSQKLFSWLETKFFKFIGAASFSIYLLHDPVLRVMQQYFPQVKQSVLLMFFVALLSIAIPCIFHKMVEVNLMAVVKKKLQQKLIKT